MGSDYGKEEKMTLSNLTLILGGVRSGKSSFALGLAKKRNGKVTYLATGKAVDAEMKARIKKHRQIRPSDWKTVEVEDALAPVLEEEGGQTQTVIVDCLGFYIVSFLGLEHGEKGEMGIESHGSQAEQRVRGEIKAILKAIGEIKSHVIIVSNEVGMGVHPLYSSGRIFRDALGLANQIIARQAGRVYFLTAGLPVEMKSLSKEVPSD